MTGAQSDTNTYPGLWGLASTDSDTVAFDITIYGCMVTYYRDLEHNSKRRITCIRLAFLLQ